LLDSVNEYEAEEEGTDAPESVIALVTAARLEVETDEHAENPAIRALLDALDPQPKEAQKCPPPPKS
jgi:hypothetical protein